MAAALGCGSASRSWISLNNNSSSSLISKMYNIQKKKRGFNYVTCASSSSALTMDPYKTLRINPDASEFEVRKSFRQLALQYHPDVCRGSNCGVQFHHINEAYDMVMSNLRGETDGRSETYNNGVAEYNPDEPMWGMHDSDWEHWEEWMGWEGAGIRDYSSHINPSI